MPGENLDFLLGRTVEQIWVWGDSIRLVFDLGQDAELSAYVDIHSDSELTAGARRATLDVRANPDEAGAVLRLLHDRVVGAAAVDGVLRLSFAGGAELTAPPDESYESWTIAADGRVFQCMPGGEVDSW